MVLTLTFIYRNKAHDCEFFIDISEFPCLIFVVLKDKDLIEIFGDDITIKTDGCNRLTKKDDYPELIDLRQTLFDVIKTTPAFHIAKNQIIFSENA